MIVHFAPRASGGSFPEADAEDAAEPPDFLSGSGIRLSVSVETGVPTETVFVSGSDSGMTGSV